MEAAAQQIQALDAAVAHYEEMRRSNQMKIADLNREAIERRQEIEEQRETILSQRRRIVRLIAPSL